jgi:hypothetical protein
MRNERWRYMKRYYKQPNVARCSRHERRSCKRKQSYQNLANAERVAAKASDRLCEKIVAYKCLFCDQFHIGHPGRCASESEAAGSAQFGLRHEQR